MYREIIEDDIKEKDYLILKEIIVKNSGIKITEAKKTLIVGRIRKRLKFLNINSISEYCSYLTSKEGMSAELLPFLEVITTNKTDFFREPEHFNFLTNNILPELLNNKKIGNNNSLKIWCAGCSTGEEAYTIAMAVDNSKKFKHQFSYDILATDLNSQVLNTAVKAVYDMDKISNINPIFKKNYFLKGKNSKINLVKISPDIKKNVIFKQLNFMTQNYNISEKFDVIFFRNVSIYFDKVTNKNILQKILKHLKSGGYLLIGHSESLIDYNLPLKQVGNSIYQKDV